MRWHLPLGLNGLGPAVAVVVGHVDEMDAALLPLRALGRDAAPFRISLYQLLLITFLHHTGKYKHFRTSRF